MTDKRKKFERLLLSSVSNLAMSFADSYIEKNVERRASAGLKATVIRRQLGECCEWCQNLAGIYTADKLPDDIYKRHANCRCMVTYKTEKVYTDAWSKKQFATEKEARLEREKEIKDEAAQKEAEQKELRLELDRKVRASRSKESIERQRQKMLEQEKEILEADKNKTNNLVDGSIKVGIIKEKEAFYSMADPMFEAFGSAENSNPEEIKAFQKEMKECGVELKREEKEKLAYSPGIEPGMPGEMKISKNASYSAWCHEMRHMRDDRKAGWSGMDIFKNKKEWAEREKRAYNDEILLAKKLGRNDIAENLHQNLVKEIARIWGKEK